MGRGQAVRHQVLALLFGGSNPSVPDKLIISNKWKTSRRKKEKKDLKRMLCSKYTYPKKQTPSEMGIATITSIWNYINIYGKGFFYDVEQEKIISLIV